jgi:hypothetical protein
MLDGLIDNGENALNFCKLKGIPPLLKCCQSKHASIQKMALSLVVCVAQNNPKPQTMFLEAKGLQVSLNPNMSIVESCRA